MNWFRLLPLSALLWTACSTLPPASPAWQPPETVAHISDPRLEELSGMAASRRQPGVRWVHNDSGGLPRLFAVDADGHTLGTLEITNATAQDWEDVAVFTLDDTPYLLIGDVGDNRAVRHDLVLYLLPEPDPRDFAVNPVMQLPATAVLPLRYENGPRDCEGITVDPARREILLISKRTEPPVLYTVPLTFSHQADEPALVARRQGPLTGIAPPTPAERVLPGRLGKFRAQVTAFDLSPDGRSAVVLTYANLYIYSRAAHQTWAEALAQPPERLAVPGLPQAEAACFDGDSNTILISTEGQNQPLVRWQRR